MKIYKKGGKLYCMRNGALVPYVPTAQEGGFQFTSAPNVDINQISNEEFGKKGNRNYSTYDSNGQPITYGAPSPYKTGWQDFGKWGNIGAGMLEGVTNKYGANTDTGKYTSTVNNFADNNSMNTSATQAIGNIPVYGGIINAFRSIGAMAQKAIKNRDQYGISGSGAQEVMGNLVDPGAHVQDSINIGKKYGNGAGWKNMLTLGLSSQGLLKDAKNSAQSRQSFEQGRTNTQNTQGNYRNDSIYARKGAEITTKPVYNQIDPTVEIEDGEIVLGDPSQIQYQGNATTSLSSPFAVKFNGDKHGTDTDGDGMQGIPLKAQEGSYVASNYLDLNGKKVKKGGNKTVAQEMEPIVALLSKAEEDPQDKYKSNPAVIEHHLRLLSQMKNQAEQGKFMEELNGMLKDKERNLDDVLGYIAQELPVNDMTEEQLAKVGEIVAKLQPQQGGEQTGMAQQQSAPSPEAQIPQQQEATMKFGGNYLSKYQAGGRLTPRQQRMKEREYQIWLAQQDQMNTDLNPPRRTFGLSLPAAAAITPDIPRTYPVSEQPYFETKLPQLGNPFIQVDNANLRNMQVSGPTSGMNQAPPRQMGGMMPQEQQAPNESNDRMNQLTQQAGQEMQYGEPGMEEQVGPQNLDPQVQQMFQQLPPEMQQQVMSLPEQQQEMAIIAMFQQMEQQGGEQEQEMPEQEMSEAPEEQLNEQMIQRFGGYNKYQGGGNIDPVQSLIQQYTNRGYLPDTARNMALNKMNEFNNGSTYADKMRNGMQEGQRVRFKKGGKIHYGTVTSYDPMTGSFEIK